MSAPVENELRDREETSTLCSFLKRSKNEYLEGVRGGKGTDWIVVMGNEAGGACPTSFSQSWTRTDSSAPAVMWYF